MRDWDSLHQRFAPPETRWAVLPGPRARQEGDRWIVPCVWPILGCAWSADGRYVAAAAGGRAQGADGTVRVLDVQTGGTWMLRGHGRGVHDVAFDPATGWLASAGHDGALGLWDLPRREGFPIPGDVPRHEVCFVEGTAWLAWAEEIPPEGERSAVGFLDLSDGHVAWRETVPATHLATSLAVAPGGTRVAFGVLQEQGRAQWALCRDTPSGRARWRVDLPPRMLLHGLAFSTHGLVQSDTERSGGRCLRLRDAETGEEIHSRQVGENIMGAFQVFGDLVASVGSDGRVELHTLPGLVPLREIPLPNVASMALAVSPDGRGFAVGSANGEGLHVVITPP